MLEKASDQGGSLHQIMNAIVSGEPEVSTKQKSQEARETALSEVDAFAQIDPLLAELHKRFLDSQQAHHQARAAHGADDYLCEIAAEAQDSDWCALQTRLLELRRDGALMALVQKKIRESEEDIESRAKQKAEKRAVDFYQRMQILQRLKNKSSKIHQSIIEWFFLFYLLRPQYLTKGFGVRSFSVASDWQLNLRQLQDLLKLLYPLNYQIH